MRDVKEDAKDGEEAGEDNVAGTLLVHLLVHHVHRVEWHTVLTHTQGPA